MSGNDNEHPDISRLDREKQLRAQICDARKIVVKIGSSSLATVDGGIDYEKLDAYATALEARMGAGSDVILVSSGAVGAGLAPLGLKARPQDLATLQAAASVGQLELSRAWGASFGRYDRAVGQVLLTANDVGLRESARNAQRTLDRLRALRAIAIVNENDTTATSEIRFGDNDRLAALVANLTSADALFLLSDVDSLYDDDPRKGPANKVSYVADSADLASVTAGAGGVLGTGGMASKLAASQLSADAGVPVLLTNADSMDRALSTGDVGTVFEARATRLSAKRFWIRHAADINGTLVVDPGAVRAITENRHSLLASGISRVQGYFEPGDVLEVLDIDGHVVAKGISQVDTQELERYIKKRKNRKKLGPPAAMRAQELDADETLVAIHADQLVC